MIRTNNEQNIVLSPLSTSPCSYAAEDKKVEEAKIADKPRKSMTSEKLADVVIDSVRSSNDPVS